MNLNLAKIAASADAAQLVFDKAEGEGFDVDAELSEMERVAVMLHTANTVPPNTALLLKIIERQKYALDRLISLKLYKDDRGKDQLYEEEQPRAWRDAFRAKDDVAELTAKLVTHPREPKS